MPIDDIIFVDEQVRLVAIEVEEMCGKQHFRSFALTYLWDKHIDEIDWDDICRESHKHKGKHDGWLHAASLTIYSVLKIGQYCGSHKVALEKLLPKLDFLTNKGFHRCDRFLCGPDIDYMMVVTFHYGDRSFSFPFYYGTNDFIRQLLCDALNSEHRNFWRRITYDMIADFEKSLGPFAKMITTIEDFSEMTLLAQVSYFKNKYEGDEMEIRNSIIAITDFYRFICFTHPKARLFGKNSTISHRLLTAPTIHRLLYENYHFFRINPFDDFGDYEKYCFILEGPYCRSTRTEEEGYAIVDISKVSSAFYRRIIIQYLQSSQRPLRSDIIYIARAMAMLEKMKSIKDYSNSKLSHINNIESNAMISFLAGTKELDKLEMDSIDCFPPSFGLHVTYVRSFLLWCNNAEKLTFDEGFFNYFKPLKYQYYKGGNPVNKQQLKPLIDYLYEKGKKDLKYHLAYIALLLLSQTEMRISHILSAKVTSFKETFKKGQYAFVGVTKTSHGEDEETHLAPQTMELFKKAIKCTSEVRKECQIEAIKDYIFLYSRSKTITVKMSSSTFNQVLRDACKELGLENRINAKRLRDTHATNADAFIDERKIPRIQLNQLTGHSSVSMTEKHYLGFELADMLEAAYGVSFTSDYDSFTGHVVEEESVNNDKSRLVQNGCGVCQAETCTNLGIPLCPVCKHFITTTNHLPYFQKAIEDIDKRISNTQNRHDIEDLVSLKEVYAKYISIIYEKLENNVTN